MFLFDLLNSFLQLSETFLSALRSLSNPDVSGNEGKTAFC